MSLLGCSILSLCMLLIWTPVRSTSVSIMGGQQMLEDRSCNGSMLFREMLSGKSALAAPA